MAMPSASEYDWTVARLHSLPDDGKRYEIIDGELYMTPSPRYVHQCAVLTLFELLRPYGREIGLDVMCLAADIEYSERTLVQPDLFAYRRLPGTKIRDWPDVQPLQLVVEVISRSTRRRDRTVKRELYQSHGIPEYWIVDVDARAIERWVPQGLAPDVLTESLDWHPAASAEPLAIALPAYFDTVLGD
jgi:Uma2 family endonuclease